MMVERCGIVDQTGHEALRAVKAWYHSGRQVIRETGITKTRAA